MDLLYLPGNRCFIPMRLSMIASFRTVIDFPAPVVQLAEDSDPLNCNDGQSQKDKVEALRQYGSGKLGPEVRFQVTWFRSFCGA